MLKQLFILLWLSVSAFVLYAQPEDADMDQELMAVDELLNNARLSDSDTELEREANSCLERSKSLGYTSGVIRSSILLGQVCARTGRPEKSLRYFLEAEDRAVSANNTSYLPNIYRLLGDLFFRQQLYENAAKYYKNVLKLTPNDSDIIEKAADASLFNRKFDDAENYYKSLIVKYKAAGDIYTLSRIYQKLANTYNEHDYPGKALYYYLRIEDLVTSYGLPYEKGRLYCNMGKLNVTLGKYSDAINYLKKAELQCEFAAKANQPCDLPEVFYTNMGIAQHNNGDTREGLKYLEQARTILVQKKDDKALASLEHLIANIYLKSSDYYAALNHNNKSIDLAYNTQQPDILVRSYKTEALIYQNLYDYEKAIDYYTEYLTLLDSLQRREQRTKDVFEQQSSQLRAAEGEIRALLAQQEIKDRDLRESRNEQKKQELLNRTLAAEAREKEQALLVLQKNKELEEQSHREQIAEAIRKEEELRLATQITEQQLDAAKKNALIAEYDRKEEMTKAQRKQEEQEVELLRQKQQNTELKLQERANFQRNTYIIGALGTAMLAVFGISWFFARRAGRRLKIQNTKIEAQKNQIEVERTKSERLLRNILPDEIADELKTRGHASPRLYDSATVLFTDFVNFTQLSTHMLPEKIISELDECFAAFDEICEKYGLEKIKTIGDAFMCAGGLPIPNTTHPLDAVKAAKEMIEWLNRRNTEKSSAVFREMRIGIHTGPVVAGVIGKNKFAYDIWGDAVNLASRLEEKGEPMRINISSSTYEAIKHEFNCIHRGQQEVHNKGLVDMYFVS